MILLLGASGYIGSEFYRQLKQAEHRESVDFCCLYRTTCDYTNPETLHKTIQEIGPELVINCAGFIPKPSVALCDRFPNETMVYNTLLPKLIAYECKSVGAVFAQISTACLWNDGQEHAEDDNIQRAFSGECGFYVGSKALAEYMIKEQTKHYIWRIRLPFDEHHSEKNYLSKLAAYDTVYDHDNSLSHRADFVRACLHLWKHKAAFGTYNICNRGHIRAVDVVRQLLDAGIRRTMPMVVPGPRTDCRVNIDKLLAAGFKMRPVEDAVADAIKHWSIHV